MTILVNNLISKCSGSDGGSEAGPKKWKWKDPGFFYTNICLYKYYSIENDLLCLNKVFLAYKNLF